MSPKKGGPAIWLEPGDPRPPDLNAWLTESGFDLTRPIDHRFDDDKWEWWTQDPSEEA